MLLCCCLIIINIISRSSSLNRVNVWVITSSSLLHLAAVSGFVPGRLVPLRFRLLCMCSTWCCGVEGGRGFVRVNVKLVSCNVNALCLQESQHFRSHVCLRHDVGSSVTALANVEVSKFKHHCPSLTTLILTAFCLTTITILLCCFHSIALYPTILLLFFLPLLFLLLFPSVAAYGRTEDVGGFVLICKAPHSCNHIGRVLLLSTNLHRHRLRQLAVLVLRTRTHGDGQLLAWQQRQQRVQGALQLACTKRRLHAVNKHLKLCFDGAQWHSTLVF